VHFSLADSAGSTSLGYVARSLFNHLANQIFPIKQKDQELPSHSGKASAHQEKALVVTKALYSDRR
jgi:hypothetical protein